MFLRILARPKLHQINKRCGACEGSDVKPEWSGVGGMLFIHLNLVGNSLVVVVSIFSRESKAEKLNKSPRYQFFVHAQQDGHRTHTHSNQKYHFDIENQKNYFSFFDLFEYFVQAKCDAIGIPNSIKLRWIVFLLLADNISSHTGMGAMGWLCMYVS